MITWFELEIDLLDLIENSFVRSTDLEVNMVRSLMVVATAWRENAEWNNNYVWGVHCKIR